MIRKYKNLISKKFPQAVFIFPTAEIIGSVELGEDVIVYPGTCARRLWKITIGDKTNLQEKRHLPCRNGLRYPCRRRCHHRA